MVSPVFIPIRNSAAFIVGAPLADARIVVQTMFLFACELRLLDEAGASASGAPTIACAPDR